MGKIVTIYLTDEETKSLTRFCEENSCSQYTAIKTGLKELLNKPIPKETTTGEQEKTKADQPTETATEKPEPSALRDILQRL